MGKRERTRARQLKKKMANGKLKRGAAQFKKLARQHKRTLKRSAPPSFARPLRYDDADGHNSQRVLVVGDGDFSFARGLVAHRSGGQGLVVTSFDSEKVVHRKYRAAAAHIAKARAAGAVVLHSVDATRLHHADVQSHLMVALSNSFAGAGGGGSDGSDSGRGRSSSSSSSSDNDDPENDAGSGGGGGGGSGRKNTKKRKVSSSSSPSASNATVPKFDRVVFNFPHTGKQRVHHNRAMVSAFLSSARQVGWWTQASLHCAVGCWEQTVSHTS